MGVSSGSSEEQKGKSPNGLTKLWNHHHDQVVPKRECQGVKRRVVFRKRNCITRRRPHNKRVIVTTDRGIVRRVRTLKSLIPNNDDDDDESQGLDGLFRDTADYILSLQMRVRVMQIMVNVLSSSEDLK